MSNIAEGRQYIWVAFFFFLVIKNFYQVYYYTKQMYCCTEHWLPLLAHTIPFQCKFQKTSCVSAPPGSIRKVSLCGG